MLIVVKTVVVFFHPPTCVTIPAFVRIQIFISRFLSPKSVGKIGLSGWDPVMNKEDPVKTGRDTKTGSVDPVRTGREDIFVNMS